MSNDNNMDLKNNGTHMIKHFFYLRSQESSTNFQEFDECIYTYGV